MDGYDGDPLYSFSISQTPVTAASYRHFLRKTVGALFLFDRALGRVVSHVNDPGKTFEKNGGLLLNERDEWGGLGHGPYFHLRPRVHFSILAAENSKETGGPALVDRWMASACAYFYGGRLPTSAEYSFAQNFGEGLFHPTTRVEDAGTEDEIWEWLENPSRQVENYLRHLGFRICIPTSPINPAGSLST